MIKTPVKFVDVSGGVRIATFEQGKGKPIVMINGLGASAHDWGPTVERLAARARVITFDNRGAGQSVARATDPPQLRVVRCAAIRGAQPRYVRAHDDGAARESDFASRVPAATAGDRPKRTRRAGTHDFGPDARRAWASRSVGAVRQRRDVARHDPGCAFHRGRGVRA